jgi:hypothetical protein
MPPFFDPNSTDPDATRLVLKQSRQRSWLGAISLIFLALLGSGLAILVQAGMTFTYDNSPEALNYFFMALGGVGKGAQYLFEGGSRSVTFPQHQLGETICKAANAVVYTLLLIWWLLSPGDSRLKK